MVFPLRKGGSMRDKPTQPVLKLFVRAASDEPEITAGLRPRYSRYEARGYYLCPVGEAIGAYDPVENPQVATDFARLGNGSLDDLVLFAERWGLLEAYDKPGDKVSWLRDHATQVKLALDLLSGLHDEDVRRVTDALSGPVSSDTRRHLPIVLGQDEELDGCVYDLSSDPMRNADLVFESIVGANIRHLHPELVRVGPGAKFEVHHHFDTTREAIYWHVAQFAVRRGGLARCEWCRRYFVMTHGNQRYCPSDEYSESPCALQARQARFRSKRHE